MANIGILG